MKLFVTGGSGFVGQRLVKRLLAEGHEVLALSRSESTSRLLSALGATPIVGSLEQIDRWSASLAGVEVVIHAASPVEFWGPWEGFFRTITLATQELYTACAQFNVRRMIYLSSESVLQDREPLLDIDETYPYPTEPNSPYGKAKKLAEQALLARATSTERIILRPTFIWGPGGGIETIATKAQAGQFMWIDGGRTVIEAVHVDNVVEAIVLALTGGRDGGIYFVTDDRPMQVREFFTALLKTRGITLPSRSVPKFLAAPLASLVERVWKILGRQTPPPLSRFELAFVAMPRRYRLDRIKTELGYQPIRTLESGLSEMQHTNPKALQAAH